MPAASHWQMQMPDPIHQNLVCSAFFVWIYSHCRGIIGPRRSIKILGGLPGTKGTKVLSQEGLLITTTVDHNMQCLSACGTAQSGKLVEERIGLLVGNQRNSIQARVETLERPGWGLGPGYHPERGGTLGGGNQIANNQIKSNENC